MTGEEQPQTTSGIPAPVAAKRPAIEITIRFDTDQLAELVEPGVEVPIENGFAPAVAPETDPALTAKINPAAVAPNSAPPPDEQRYRQMHALVALGIAMMLAAVTGVLVDWQAAVTVLVSVLELFVAFRDGQASA